MMRRLVPLLCCVVALAGCAVKGPLQHSEFNQRQLTIQTIVVVPADVVFSLDTVSDGAQRNATREAQIRWVLQRAGERQLQARGYRLHNALAEQLGKGDNELAFAAEQLRGRYGSVVEETNKRSSGDDALVKATLGPQSTAWAASAGADALLIVRYQGFERSKGKAVIDSVPGVLLAAVTGFGYVANTSGGYLEVALIDAVSGEVLWVNDTRDTKVGAPFTPIREMTPVGMLAYVLKSLPKAAAPKDPGAGNQAGGGS
jgi:hypothetical protein